MATWDDIQMYGYSLKDLGLRTCPFDASHKIKPNNYTKHVLKCEQRFPKSNTLSSESSSKSETNFCLNSSRFSSIDSFLDSRTNGSDINGLTKSISNLNTDDNWSTAEEPIIPVPSTSGLTNRSLSPDSAIGLTNNMDSNETNTEMEFRASPQTSGLTVSQMDGQNTQNESSTNNSRSSEVVPIIPQQVTSIPEPTIDNKNKDNGSGDSDNEWTAGKDYSLYEGFECFDDLTDDQIMEMANSFIDVVVLTKMTKIQRKQLNDKLIELRKAEKGLKKKAFQELVTFKDVWDPQLKDIPQEIRKPRIDVREMFNLNKKQNKRIDTVMSTTPISPEAKECPPNPWVAGTSKEAQKLQPLGLNYESGQSSADCCSESPLKQLSDRHGLNTVCNNCWDSLAVNEESIKRMTIFCAKCSGVKFGGYFECHSCKLYGYFAKSQISLHLTKHFPQNN